MFAGANCAMSVVRYEIDATVLKDWMVKYLAEVLMLERSSISTTDNFDVIGLDSVEAVIMAGVMEDEFQIVVDPHQFFEAPSIEQFVEAYATPASAFLSEA